MFIVIFVPTLNKAFIHYYSLFNQLHAGEANHDVQSQFN